ncbi:MAG: endonuclease III [Bacteroidales bacterium]|nr:endonuclease III [Bacteroidales bacterium]
MRISDRYAAILDYFSRNVPVAQSELDFGSPYELLVAVMLSAQCTDRRVNLTTPALFRRFPDMPSLAAADVEEVKDLIRSISYPNSKAAHLVEMAKMSVAYYGGEVPASVEELMRLPGVGRKTANVVASIVHGEPVIAVDTHVFRVSHRLGLSRGRTPEAVERDLERHVPAQLRPIAHHWLILHGRYICTSRSPQCDTCPLSAWCLEYGRRKIEKNL